MTETTAVLERLGGPPAARRSVVLLPSAGTGAWAYRDWGDLDTGCAVFAVCPPGREARIADPPWTALDQAIEDIRRALPEGELVLLGHSIGALIAFEVAKRRTPDLLVTAACQPPGAVAELLATGDDDLRTFADEVVDGLGLADDDVRAELTEMVLDALRADVALLRDYEPGGAVGCPVISLYGTGDELGTEPWTRWTAAHAALRLVDGGHDFPRDLPAATWRAVEDALTAGAVAPAWTTNHRRSM